MEPTPREADHPPENEINFTQPSPSRGSPERGGGRAELPSWENATEECDNLTLVRLKGGAGQRWGWPDVED